MKTTKASVLNHFTCISVGYCSLQSLLNWKRRTSHTEGVYGWNADVYTFDDRQNIAIVTGYRPFGEHVDGELIRKYEEKARKIDVKDWEVRQQKLKELTYEFIDEAMAEIMNR